MGTGRTDLYITSPIAPEPTQGEFIGIKVKRERHSAETVLQRGIEQSREYMQRCGANRGHLVIFDAPRTKAGMTKSAHKHSQMI